MVVNLNWQPFFIVAFLYISISSHLLYHLRIVLPNSLSIPFGYTRVLVYAQTLETPYYLK